MHLDDRETLELDQLALVNRKLKIETRKCHAEIDKLRRDRQLHPLLIGTAAVTALAALYDKL